jgi:hypothetical protein
MKLFYNRPSPYARKVLVFIHEKKLADAVDLVAVDPWTDPPELLAATPLAKVPPPSANASTGSEAASPSPERTLSSSPERAWRTD